jgi:hypothetical protein
MQKVLCIIALSIALIVFVLFLSDLVFGMAGMVQVAPFRYANMTMDIVFAGCALAVGLLSWFTFRDQA